MEYAMRNQPMYAISEALGVSIPQAEILFKRMTSFRLTKQSPVGPMFEDGFAEPNANESMEDIQALITLGFLETMPGSPRKVRLTDHGKAEVDSVLSRIP